MRAASGIGFLFAVLAWASLLNTAGCSGGSSNWARKHKTLSSKESLELAMESEQPDERRRGVVGLAKSPDGRSEWAVKVFDTLARTDPDTMVRCAALRAIAPAVDPARVETCLLLLDPSDVNRKRVRAAPPLVRWCAARLLFEAVQRQAFEASQSDAIATLLIGRIPVEDDSNARLAMIETLGFFPERRVLDALVDAMDGPNFAIDHAAEISLARLTGVTHDHQPDAWRKWLAETEDPFANSGALPASLASKDSKAKWDFLGWME